LEIISQIVEDIDDLIKGEEKDEDVWNLLTEVFEKIEYSLIYYYFVWNLFSILGYQIDLYHCVNCQKKLISGKLYFTPEEGGITCCGQGEQISAEVVKILRLFLKKDWNILLRLKIQDSHRQELEKIKTCFLDKIIL